MQHGEERRGVRRPAVDSGGSVGVCWQAGTGAASVVGNSGINNAAALLPCPHSRLTASPIPTTAQHPLPSVREACTAALSLRPPQVQPECRISIVAPSEPDDAGRRSDHIEDDALEHSFVEGPSAGGPTRQLHRRVMNSRTKHPLWFQRQTHVRTPQDTHTLPSVTFHLQ